MKILILSQSRSGSTSLVDAIIFATNLDYIHEPFNLRSDFEKDINDIKNRKNIIVKIVDNHFYKVEEFLDYKKLTVHFDKVIGLTRVNDYENARSRWIAERLNSWDFSSKNVDISSLNLDEARLDTLLFESSRNRLQITSFDIFQVTYEGLYIYKNELQQLEDYLEFKVGKYIRFE